MARNISVSFTTIQRNAWQYYFSNALSVLSELLLSPSNIVAVQALALMACYVGGLGSPEFQHVLCSCAVHAAVIQGIHQEQESRAQHRALSDDQIKRAWLWWSIYALEKNLSLCSGRSSIIDDQTMTTEVPSQVPAGSMLDLEIFVFAIRHAKLNSRISRQLELLKVARVPTAEFCTTVMKLDQQLKDLLSELPSSLRIGTLAKPHEEGNAIPRRIHAFYLHFSLHGSLMALHSHFFYPWMSTKFSNEGVLESQIAYSCRTVTEAARKILLAVRMVTANVATPTCLALSYPIYAHLSLFINVLKNPTASTTSADLGLLDVCAGHFGYIDFMTSSEISISLPRESVNLAAKVAKLARRKTHDPATTARATSSDHLSVAQSVNGIHGQPLETGLIGNCDAMWSLLSPFDPNAAFVLDFPPFAD